MIRSRRLMLALIQVNTIHASRKLSISPIRETKPTSGAKLPMIANRLKEACSTTAPR